MRELFLTICILLFTLIAMPVLASGADPCAEASIEDNLYPIFDDAGKCVGNQTSTQPPAAPASSSSTASETATAPATDFEPAPQAKMSPDAPPRTASTDVGMAAMDSDLSDDYAAMMVAGQQAIPIQPGLSTGFSISKVGSAEGVGLGISKRYNRTAYKGSVMKSGHREGLATAVEFRF